MSAPTVQWCRQEAPRHGRRDRNGLGQDLKALAMQWRPLSQRRPDILFISPQELQHCSGLKLVPVSQLMRSNLSFLRVRHLFRKTFLCTQRKQTCCLTLFFFPVRCVTHYGISRAYLSKCYPDRGHEVAFPGAWHIGVISALTPMI